MQRPAEIVFRNLPHSEAVDAAIRKRIDKLADRYHDIVGCTVTVESHGHHSHKGHLYAIGIELSVPGPDLVVNRSPPDDHAHEDIFVAIRDAFDALERQVEKHEARQRIERRRGQRPEKKHRGANAQGRVERLFAGEDYGFIGTPDGRHIYFHRNAVLEGWDDLEIGDPVEFLEEAGNDGPQASTVRKLRPWKAADAGPRH